MKKNQLVTTKSTALVLGKTKSLMGITKRLLDGSKKGLAKATPSQDLTTHKDITIIGDLMWEKETQERMSWYAGMEYAKNLRLGGYDDWRLPTIDELSEVVTLCGGISVTSDDNNWVDIWGKNQDNENYQTNHKAKGFVSNGYWSSTTYASNTSRAWNTYFFDGFLCGDRKSFDYTVRCVRSGQ